MDNKIKPSDIFSDIARKDYESLTKKRGTQKGAIASFLVGLFILVLLIIFIYLSCSYEPQPVSGATVEYDIDLWKMLLYLCFIVAGITGGVGYLIKKHFC